MSGGPLGGSFSIIRPFLEYQKYIPDWLSKGRNTFAFRLQAMHMIPFGKLHSGAPMSAPFFERVFSGGEYDLRGFDLRSVSPWAISRKAILDSSGNAVIDPATGLPTISENVTPVGGDTSIVLTAEYRIPLMGPMQLVPFVDFGTSTVVKTSNLVLFGPRTYV